MNGRSPEDGDDDPPRLIENVPSLIGFVLIVAGVTGFAFLIMLDFLPGDGRAYPILTLIPSVAVLLLGTLLSLGGMVWEALQRRRGREPSFSRGTSFGVRQLRGKSLFSIGAVTVALTLAILTAGTLTSELYAVTESNTFCGEACHSVMEPEWVTFQSSPHARVRCVDCHVGPKPKEYTLVKLNGLSQLAAVATGNFERPIATPIRNLRPAREICEQCHWSERFIGYRERTSPHFLADEQNTPLALRMLVKIGGGPGLFSNGSGIHYHMFVAQQVEYIARDPARQQIRWVRLTDASGTVTEYEDRRDRLSDEDRAGLETRTMDCLDCHSRPAHRFPAPIDSVDRAIEGGAVSRELPYIKREGVRALDAGYANREEAMAGIASHLQDFYDESDPELGSSRQELLESSISALQTIYQKTIFPEMRVSWSDHPDNIGHRDSPGCFRCHNDRMRSADGRTIVTACNSCHVILAQGEDVQQIETNLETGEPFMHPEEWEYLEEYTECVECHTGGAALYE